MQQHLSYVTAGFLETVTVHGDDRTAKKMNKI